MDRLLPDPLLARYSEFLAARIGLHYPEERWRDLERATRRAARDLGFDDAQACVEQLLSRPPSRTQIEVLASHLTVGETYFFRDRASFDALQSHVLPELIQRRRASVKRLRIWSAGCCTGEEAYSIAILLARLIPDLEAWNILILATDINPQFLKKASRGVYTHWSFRDVPSEVKERFFQPTKAGLEIAARIKTLVTFEYHNLAEDTCPSLETNTNAMDIIFCRNVVMYFNPARSKQLMSRLVCCLLEGGWLFVSPIETPQVPLPCLAEVKLSGTILYRKGSTLTISGTRLLVEPTPVEPAAAASSSHPSFTVPGSRRIDPSGGELRVAAPQIQPRHGDAPIGPAVETDGAPTREAQVAPDREAVELYRQGRYSDAAERLHRAMELNPTDPGLMGLLARIQANQGSFEQAAHWCNRAVAADKLNPQWCYLLATVLQEQDQLEGAAAALKRAVYLDPNHAMAHFSLGNVTRKQGKLKESERHFRNAQSSLKRVAPEQVLPESEGITAGRLAEIIASTTEVWR
jgi:chemotaxis protein methyltransferase CheR